MTDSLRDDSATRARRQTLHTLIDTGRLGHTPHPRKDEWREQLDRVLPPVTTPRTARERECS
ncbi:hypothetical protein GCM10023086_22950 [Streptomyces venetus]|uniref:Uncharacterized protein n=1 Tax=Streptomyces venetus TaxID=1701086 RepID=A0ABP8FJH4_9ACTN